MRKCLLYFVMLVLSACDKVVIDYQELIGGEDAEGIEMAEENAGVWVTCDVRADGIGGNGTRGLSADGVELTDLWVFDCGVSECKMIATQNSEDAGFGKVKFKLDKGTHRLAFVVSRGEDAEWNESSGRIAWGKVKDTFWGVKDVEIDGGAGVSMSVALDRVVGKLNVAFSDVVPAELKAVSAYVDEWLCGLDVRTGEGVGSLTSEQGENTEMEVSVPAAYVGTTGLQIVLWGFSRDAGFTTGVDFVWRDSDGESITEKRCEDVPLWKNRITKVMGLMMSGEATVDLSVGGRWGEEYDYEM